MFNRVLCGYDDSRSSRAALAVATGLARGAAFRVCRVIERDNILADIGAVPGAAELADEVISVAESDLELLRKQLARELPFCEVVAPSGTSAWETLTSDAAYWHGDLIVIGAGERGRGLLGSTSEQVVRHAHCAVLVVSGTVERFTSLLCAVDFSATGEEALRVAADLAADLDAALTLAHRISPRDEALFAQGAAFAGALDARGHAEAVLRDHAAKLDPPVAARTAIAVLEGATAEAILGQARRSACDLVVVGSHGRTGLSRMLLGSVAENIVRHADRSVLVVRENDVPAADRADRRRRSGGLSAGPRPS